MMKKLWMKVSALCLLAGGACSAWVAEAQPSQVLQSEQNAIGLSLETVTPFAPGTLLRDRIEAQAVSEAVVSAEKVGSSEAGRVEAEGRFSHVVPPAIPHEAVRVLSGRAAKSSVCDTIYLTTNSLNEFSISMIFVGSGYGYIDWGDGSTSTYEAVEETGAYEWQTCRHSYGSERSRRIMIYTTEPGTRIIALSMWYYTAYQDVRTGLISGMDLSRCPNMTWLYVQRQFLPHLDVSRNAALVRINCQYNELSNLDVSGCLSLQELFCDTNSLEALYVAGADSLRWLTCRRNSLTALDVSGRACLQVLEVNDNARETLSADGCPALERLKCQRNVLRELRLKG
ncbi:MAG: hypothetical protein K2H70_01790, partial [Bacteroidales bacterium]|nr:hypothetical protein [Bacteroidales bacterium]